ncbi:MAG: hypothetical protein GF344_11325 [Chitinivibrionales bacterium]|nr:hypothetical protein [Chitinivibrionales bacterium]MBD3357390.1 hypothetical protein [Chitinivibrionales bacterium]
MKVVVLDQVVERHRPLMTILAEKRHTHVFCAQTAKFMEEVDFGAPDRVLMDVPSWRHGAHIYKYFELGRKLEEIPIVFYNAPVGFVSIRGRRRHELDRVLPENSGMELLAEAID